MLGCVISSFLLSLLFIDITLASALSREQLQRKTSHMKPCLPCEGLDPSARLSQQQVLDRVNAMPLWTAVPMKTSTASAADVVDSSSTVAAASMVAGDVTEEPLLILSRQFTARNFQAAMDALNAMGAIAERENHHFDFHLTSYRNVRIDIYTHAVNGLTENDFILADLLDTEVTVDYSPKWLNEQSVFKPPKD
jgi:pterin-4a-carbinolamine dehydratase